MKITITGPSGSGKSTFASLLAKKINADICEVDMFFRDAFLEHQDIMKSYCGEKCINEDGTINFGVLSLLPPEKDFEVRKILSGCMNEKINEKAEQAYKNNKHIIFDYLFLTDCSSLMKSDLIILMDTPLDIRYKRMLQRGKDRFKFTKEEFVAMDNLVKSTLTEFQPHIIINNSSKSKLETEANKISSLIKNVK